jgi:DNA-binding MarR family transcriptional regulator
MISRVIWGVKFSPFAVLERNRGNFNELRQNAASGWAGSAQSLKSEPFSSESFPLEGSFDFDGSDYCTRIGMEAIDSHPVCQRIDRWVFAWCALTQRSRRWHSALDDALRPYQLAACEFLVLWRTGHAAPPGISQVELARELNVSAAQVCGVVEKLQDRQWLQTARPLQDRRRLYCSLTPDGVAELQRLVSDLLPIAERCLGEDASEWRERTDPACQEEAA